MIYVAFGIVAWVACGVVAKSLVLSGFKDRCQRLSMDWEAYEYRSLDEAVAVMFLFLGPLGLFIALVHPNNRKK